MKNVTLAALLGLVLLAVLAMPANSAPAPANCMMESMGIDSDKLGSLLNVILSIVIQLLYNNNEDPCKQEELMDEMEGAMGDMMCFMEDQSEDGKGLLEILLGPILEAVGDLLQTLLGGGGGGGGGGGLLESVGNLLSTVINLVLCLLKSLGLDVDLNLMLKLGDLLNLDLSAILNLA